MEKTKNNRIDCTDMNLFLCNNLLLALATDYEKTKDETLGQKLHSLLYQTITYDNHEMTIVNFLSTALEREGIPFNEIGINPYNPLDIDNTQFQDAFFVNLTDIETNDKICTLNISAKNMWKAVYHLLKPFEDLSTD